MVVDYCHFSITLMVFLVFFRPWSFLKASPLLTRKCHCGRPLCAMSAQIQAWRLPLGRIDISFRVPFVEAAVGWPAWRPAHRGGRGCATC